MNKETEVTIVPNKMGAKIRVSVNNAEYAHVLLKQEKTIISSTGWVKPSVVHALLHGKLEDIQSIGIAELSTLPGQIVVKESLGAFDSKNPEQDYKYAGKTGVVCCKHGEPIYRKCFYDPTMLEIDELVSHTNGDDIRIAGTSDEDTKTALKAEQAFLKEYFPGDQIDLEDSIAQVEAENKAEDTTFPSSMDDVTDEQPTIEEKQIVETPESNPFDNDEDDEVTVNGGSTDVTVDAPIIDDEDEIEIDDEPEITGIPNGDTISDTDDEEVEVEEETEFTL